MPMPIGGDRLKSKLLPSQMWVTCIHEITMIDSRHVFWSFQGVTHLKWEIKPPESADNYSPIFVIYTYAPRSVQLCCRVGSWHIPFMVVYISESLIEISDTGIGLLTMAARRFAEYFLGEPEGCKVSFLTFRRLRLFCHFQLLVFI